MSRRSRRAAKPTTEHRARATTEPRAARVVHRAAWPALAIAGLAIVTYANTLGHGFVWDDPILLEQKVRFYRGPLDAWFEPPGLPGMRMYRPLEMMSLWMDQALWWRNGVGFHLTQILLHALNGALLVALLLALHVAVRPALAAAAVFVVHPVQVESVAWLTCRADVLTGTFALLATLWFVRYRQHPSWQAAVVIGLAAFLCTASKESGVVTPALLAAAAWALHDGRSSASARPWSALPALGAAALGVLACMALRPANVTTGIDLASFDARDLLNLAGSLGYHIGRVLLPVGFAPYVPRTPTDAWHLALAGAGSAALAAAILLPSRDGGIRRFGALWFLIAIAPAVTVVLADFTATPVAERRLYLGMVGAALLVAAGLTVSGPVLQTRAGLAAIAALVATLMAVTVLRNRHWHDELTLWTAVTDRLRTEPLPYLNLGLALASRERLPEAETAYRHALTLAPATETRQQLAINLGLVLIERGELDEAAALFTTANEIAPHAIAYRGLGVVARQRAQAARRAGDATTAARELARARAALEQAVAFNPRYHQAYFSLAGVLYDSGQYRAALAHYRRVVNIAGDTDTGRQAAGAIEDLSAWLAAHPDQP